MPTRKSISRLCPSVRTNARGALAALLVLLSLPAAGTDDRFRIDTIAEGLDHPWSAAFLPDGRVLVTERAGRLRIIGTHGLDPEPVDGVPAAFVASQAGLFDVLADPDFAENGLIYLTLAAGDRRANRTELWRGRLEDGRLLDTRRLFQAEPDKATAVHHGGRLALLPDHTLLLGLGDGFNYRERAQSVADHFGVIVRLDRDGSAPADNPFAGRTDARPEIYSYGHRNVQGIAWHAGLGRIYAHEHGPRGGDELNHIMPGANYGWPVATHGLDYSGARVSPYQAWPDTESPLLYWTPAIAPAGLAVYDGDLFADWQGDLLVAALVGRHVQRVSLDGAGRPAGTEILFEEQGERIRDVRVAPDGSIWLLTDSADGRVLRVTPAGRAPESVN
ncbi:MAG: PQQ-dependent sugar dehydrogenase [Chromatiales bacterium]|nr:PQQ-dependent sugar dehydrogenase [Chromatiales bacterium]